MHCDFELFMAKHCAPLLLGKKPASLFSRRQLPKNFEWTRLREQGFCIHNLCWKSKVMVLIYHPGLLDAALSQKKARIRLSGMGYPAGCGHRELVRHLQRRFCESGEFPHEVGFFLGYPPDDVIGFMDDEGKCKLCGQWKVYGDESRAAAIFEEYGRDRKSVV